MLYNRCGIMMAFAILLLNTYSFSQIKAPLPKVNDTTKKAIDTPKTFAQFILPEAKVDSGLFTVYNQKDRFFLEIKPYILGKDILMVSRISKGGADTRGAGNMIGFAGDEINNAVIRLEQGVKNRIYIRQCSFTERSKDSTKEMYHSVMNANLLPIVASFPIEAYSKSGDGYIIDVTDYFNGDNPMLFFSPQMKATLKLGALQADRSYISKISSYPINTEIRAIKTYEKVAASGIMAMFFPDGGSNSITIEVNVSIVLLPEKPMKPRYNDDRVGYFTIGYKDFDLDPQGVKDIFLIKRWNLHPRKEDMEKYNKGELVVPEKPIVFYIDPATPKKWVASLIQGVNDWQVAFENAGFKNAIQGKRAPTLKEDSTWSLEDARHSAIVYKPSTLANASGPSIADPRSGEILESHINWYHNVMSLLKDWYIIQASPSDKRARTNTFSDSLMGQLIRFVASHEVGHTLGLLHNFGSSSTVPVDSLRNKKWVEKNGHTPSIMDYARFNYVAQPEDSIGDSGIFPRIGDYDKWAIEFGYRIFPENETPGAEKKRLNHWVINKLQNKRLFFGYEGLKALDPRSQSEAVGDDAMKAGHYGIKNLQFILPHLKEWVTEPNEDYSSLEKSLELLIRQYSIYINHVSVNIGGLYITPKTTDQPGDIFELVPKKTQKRALTFLDKQLFTTPFWLIEGASVGKVRVNIVNVIGQIQKQTLDQLMGKEKLNILIQYRILNPKDSYDINDYFSDLKKVIWSELYQHKPVDIFRRNLQKTYLSNLLLLSGLTPVNTQRISSMTSEFSVIETQSDQTISDMASIAKAQVIQLKSEIKKAIPQRNDLKSRQHLQDVLNRIERVYTSKE